MKKLKVWPTIYIYFLFERRLPVSHSWKRFFFFLAPVYARTKSLFFRLFDVREITWGAFSVGVWVLGTDIC